MCVCVSWGTWLPIQAGEWYKLFINGVINIFETIYDTHRKILELALYVLIGQADVYIQSTMFVMNLFTLSLALNV